MKLFLGAAVMCAAALLAAPRAVVGQAPQARKIDEVGQNVRGCDHGARLDNFATELMNDPDADGYVIAYGPRGEGSGTADFRLEVTKDYFVNTRGLDAGRIRTINAGRYQSRDKSLVELWLVPPGAEPPQPPEYENDADKFTGKFSEHEAWDSFEWGEATGPPVGNSALAGFADALQSQPGTRAYIVAFNGEESAPGAWRRVAERQTEALQRHGIAGERLRVVFGGYAQYLKLQLWILPKDAPPPARDAGPERQPTEAASVGRMNDYQLRFEREQRSLFRGFAEVLKADKTLTAHLVIRLPNPPAGDGEAAEPPDPEEPPEVDMSRLVEKWKDELQKEYGIGGERVVVQVVPPTEDWGDEGIEAWVVPAGAAPPDPYAEEQEQTSETEEDNPKEL